MTQYIVKWRNEQTGVTGHGSPVSQETAQSWVEQSNKDYPGFNHWMEAAPVYEPSNWPAVPGLAKKRNRRPGGRTGEL